VAIDRLAARMSRRGALLGGAATLAVVALVAVALAAGGGGASGEPTVDPPAIAAAALGGLPELPSVVYEPAQPMPDIVLTRHDGEPFRLSDYRGQVVALYFGYTNCPDVCPLTLSSYERALRELPEALRDEVHVVMVTVDPERDSAAVLANYVPRFDPGFVGATGDPREVQAALRSWRIRAEKEQVSADGSSYFMAHPSSSYVIDRTGARRLKVPHSISVEQLALDLRSVIEEG
jgi:protein SCO1